MARRTLAALAALAAMALTTNAQFVKPPADLKRVLGHAGVPVRYKEVPQGICELDSRVKSYSGYADVTKDEHIFFWFFEARDVDPEKAPLTVWINGGPGSSSMLGLFEELGPCRIDPSGKVYSNPYSWSNVSNLLFIDQPTQVGFSYSSPVDGYKTDYGIVTLPKDPVSGETICPEYAPEGSCGTFAYPDPALTAKTTKGAAPNFWKTLQGFIGAFPKYARNGVHLATESYGGHYGPIFAEYVHKTNLKLGRPGAGKHIKLNTLLIGNGWYDPIIQYQAYYNFTVSPGNTYDYAPFDKVNASMFYNNLYGKGNCIDRLNHCKKSGDNLDCKDADNFCAYMVENVYDEVLGRDEYDMRELAPDPFPYRYYRTYLNQPDVQAAIGAYTNWTVSNDAVGNAFDSTGDDGREDGTVKALRNLLKRNHVEVHLYAGDADYNCNWLGSELIAEAVAKGHSHAHSFASAGYRDFKTSDGIVHGQVKQGGHFSFTRFYEAGHEVPFYQPLASLEYFTRAIKHLDIETGTHKVHHKFRTEGPAKSTYREGNATIQFDVTPANLTYDVHRNGPGAPWPDLAQGKVKQEILMKRSFQGARGVAAKPPRRSSDSRSASGRLGR